MNEKDKNYLKSTGKTDEQISRIASAMTKVKCFYPTYADSISGAEARRILGDELFFSGLEASARTGQCLRGREGQHVGFALF